MSNLLKQLNKLANHLDLLGFFDYANFIDSVAEYNIIRLAMSHGDALSLLGLSANPTEDDINSAYKQKAFEHHPDRGGNEEIMKQINAARDVLLEGATEPTSTYKSEPVRTQSRPRTERVTTFEDAVKNANIPADVQWKFVTASGHGRNLGGSQSGRVAYGTSGESHVFVGIFDYKYDNMFENTKIDETSIHTYIAPREMSLAGMVSGAIDRLWSEFNDVNNFNGKVYLLDEGTELKECRWSVRGRAVSLKDALVILGETKAEVGGKVRITMELGESSFDDKPQQVTFVVNGIPYALSADNCARAKRAGLAKFVFGTYVYGNMKKDLMRIPKDKAIKLFNFVIKHFKDSEPKELIDAAESAIAQLSK